MQAIRFLTDILNGDIYYYPKQNLPRAQNQFTLLPNCLETEERLDKIIHNFTRKGPAVGR
jgi:hypothetical protein